MYVLTLEKVEDLAESQHINVTEKVQMIKACEQIRIKSRGQILARDDFVLAVVQLCVEGWHGRIISKS